MRGVVEELAAIREVNPHIRAEVLTAVVETVLVIEMVGTEVMTAGVHIVYKRNQQRL
jgi:hypothetical protein